MTRRPEALDYSMPISSSASSSTRTPRKKKKTGSPRKTKKTLPDPHFVGGEPTAPKKEEWERMNAFQSFVVVDDTGQEHRFPLQVYALVLPEGADPNGSLRLRDYWVGKIKEIRSRNNDPSDVWVNTQWLMSIEDVLKQKRVDPTPFGKMERILSDHFDFVHTSCFADIAQVAPYREDDPEPRPISDETFYYRYTYYVRTRELEPTPSATCFCGEAYNANETGIMHFCPRKGCCKAFHADCLRQAGFVENPRKDVRSLRAQRALLFERTLPDISNNEGEDDMQEDEGAPASRASSSNTLVDSSGRVTNRHSENHDNNASPVDRHWEVPAELLALARSPMVKGIGTDLPYEWSCVTGNYSVVIRARRLVKEIVEDGKGVPVKWRSMLEIPGEEDQGEDIDSVTLKGCTVGDDNLFLCPCCKGAI